MNRRIPHSPFAVFVAACSALSAVGVFSAAGLPAQQGPATLVSRVVAQPSPPLAQSATASTIANNVRPADYNWDVRPILSENCFSCHGPDEKSRRAGLRLDQSEGAYSELRQGRRAIVPGEPDRSEILRRVTAENPVQRMPPQTANKVLTREQVEVLRAWIAQGARYKPHWAFIPPEKVVPPPARPGAPAASEIDRFLLAQLESRGLSFSREADKETLLNRLTLTLTGLPPTLAEVDAFVNDKSATAYEKAVNRLLASPAYAEHMAGYWLNVARYSESDGFLDDLHDRLFWPYRDWVISAFRQEHALRSVCEMADRWGFDAERHERSDSCIVVSTTGEAHD